MTKYCLLIASILLFSSQANAELTLSLDLFQDLGDRDLSGSSSSDDFSIDSSTADSTGYRLRLGFNSVKENRVELYFSQYEVDDVEEGDGLLEVFNYKDEWELGVNYIVTFLKQPANPSLKPITPFLKVGLGYGQADTDMEFTTGSGSTTDNISNAHFNLGGGVSYSFTDNVAVSGGIEYIYRNWQDIDVQYSDLTNSDLTIGTTDSLFRFNVGIDVSF